MTIRVTLTDGHECGEAISLDRNYQAETTTIIIDLYGAETAITVATPELMALVRVAGLS